MTKLFTKSLAAVAIAAMAFTAVSCHPDDPIVPSGDEADAKAEVIVAQFVDHTVAPTYSSLAAKAEQLADKLAALKANPTDAGVQEACAIFLEARAQWEMSEAFLFGAAGDFGIDPHIDSWPLDVTNFNTLMNSPEMLNRLAGDDGDVVAGDNLGNALLGFHGIEYILFANGQPKSASVITANEWIYAAAVAGDLRNRCYQLEVSWIGDAAPESHAAKVEELELNSTVAGGDLSYGENMKKAGQAGSTYYSRIAALMAIVDGCKTISDEVGTSKIGSAYSGEDETYIESPYSQKSIVDFHDNIVSIQNAYMGGVEGQRDESKSLHAFVKASDADLDARVIAAINNAIAKIDAMPAPFVNHISDPANGVAMEACQAVDEVFSEVNELLRSI
jgi:hypothetical protein